MRRSAAALLSAIFVMLGASVAVADEGPDYLRTAYSGVIWEVTDTDAHPLSWDEWSSRGFPAFTAAHTRFSRVLSFRDVTASTTFDRAAVEISEPVTWPMYQAAGYPQLETRAWGPGIRVHQWSTSPELFATDTHGDVVKLDYGQWSRAGFPTFEKREGRGFIKMSWDASGDLAYLCDTALGKGGRLTRDEWASLGFPTPLPVTRTVNDFVWQPDGRGPRISYIGPTLRDYTWRPQAGLRMPRELTLSEWRSMGSPTPETTNPIPSERINCGSLPSPWV